MRQSLNAVGISLCYIALRTVERSLDTLLDGSPARPQRLSSAVESFVDSPIGGPAAERGIDRIDNISVAMSNAGQ
jgi:hypothetical protein